MAAVSLSEAWNDPPPPAPSNNHDQSTSIDATSAKVVRSVTPVVNHKLDDEPRTQSVTTLDWQEHQGHVELSNARLLEELRALRVDESRRCTVYLAVGGILFAILFVYIDRLQQQIRMMNTFFIQRPSLGNSEIVQEQAHIPFQLPPRW